MGYEAEVPSMQPRSRWGAVAKPTGKKNGDWGRVGREGSETRPALDYVGPLLSPGNSVVLVVDPLSPSVDDPPKSARVLPEAAEPVCRCAQRIGVPVIVSILGQAGDSEPLPDAESTSIAEGTLHSRHVLNPWDSADVVEALRKANRRRLVLLGGWCEATVVMAALSALADGYDVHVVVDCCPGLVADSAGIALHRMVQAGVVPITWRQVVFEWLRHRPELRQPAFLRDVLSADTTLVSWIEALAHTLL